MLIYFLAIWNILRTFDTFYGHLGHLVFIWYIFPAFGIVYQEKSGNPVLTRRQLWSAARVRSMLQNWRVDEKRVQREDRKLDYNYIK
jgi:hypothetical protein